MAKPAKELNGRSAYELSEQVGFILRQVSQRHTAIFADLFEDALTPTQFSPLVRLYERDSCPQNELGRLTAMDAATIKGVVERLRHRGLVETTADRTDRRRLLVSLTDAGRAFVDLAIPVAQSITRETLEPLNTEERELFLGLLKKLR